MLRAQQNGLTLIELMIVVAIVSILASIAYPSYQSQVRKSRRAAAEAFMMDVAGRQEQRMLDVRSYSTTVPTLPAELNGFYTVAITLSAAGAPPGFTITATPTGMQLKDTGCNPLTLTNTRVKTPAACW
ncbi:MAG TPA: type IV pilin protein [Steroidobacter sp.]|nr:type IV pilin protein [Steroidobacter sp.]